MEHFPNHSFREFRDSFKLLATKNPKAILNTLSNVFTMRIIGNKTHGDLAEIALSEFINQFMYNYSSRHVGKDLFRSKEHEEDILVTNDLTKESIPISLKAYGHGPLQLSTDKKGELFPILTQYGSTANVEEIQDIVDFPSFRALNDLNVLPLIYKEKEMKCNIMHFDFERARKDICEIVFVDERERYDYEQCRIVKSKGRSHPIFLFLNKEHKYIFEIRYGGKSANALQRGLWTHTENAKDYFDSLTNGWIDYSHNMVLVKLFSLALNSTQHCHELSCEILQKGIDDLRIIR